MGRRPKSDLAKVWAERIERAESRRKAWEEEMRVQQALAYYKGQQNPGYPPAEWITVNKIYSHLQAQLPSLYSVDPYFYVRLKRSYSPYPDDIVIYEKMGKTRAAYLNYLKEELNLKTTARLAIQDAHFAYGVVKVHYVAEELKNPTGGSAIADEDGKPLMGEDGQALFEPDFVLANERYAVTRVDPSDFLWDEDAGPLADKWAWVGERIRMTKSQARNDRRLKPAVLASLETEARDEGDSDSQQVYCLYEVYDLRAKQWLIVSEDAETVVMDPRPLPAGVEQHPYCILRFTLQPDSPYPIPPVSVALDPQREYGLARSRLLTHRKRFNRKYQLYGPAFDDPDIAASRLETGEDGTVLVSNVPQDAIRPISDAPLDQASYLEIQQLNADLIELMGSSDEARGISGADSATQAALIDKRMDVREGDRQSLVIDWVRDIARKLDQLVQVHITGDEAVRIVGPDGESWEMVRTTDYRQIAGEYSYEVNVGSTMPRIPQVERAQWLAFLQLVAQAPQLMLSKRLMQHMAELHHIEDSVMLEELQKIGEQVTQGLLPGVAGGGTGGGSSPGVPETGILKGVLGQALGALGGNAGGGGAASLGQA